MKFTVLYSGVWVFFLNNNWAVLISSLKCKIASWFYIKQIFFKREKSWHLCVCSSWYTPHQPIKYYMYYSMKFFTTCVNQASYFLSTECVIYYKMYEAFCTQSSSLHHICIFKINSYLILVLALTKDHRSARPLWHFRFFLFYSKIWQLCNCDQNSFCFFFSIKLSRLIRAGSLFKNLFSSSSFTDITPSYDFLWYCISPGRLVAQERNSGSFLPQQVSDVWWPRYCHRNLWLWCRSKSTRSSSKQGLYRSSLNPNSKQLGL